MPSSLATHNESSDGNEFDALFGDKVNFMAEEVTPDMFDEISRHSVNAGSVVVNPIRYGDNGNEEAIRPTYSRHQR